MYGLIHANVDTIRIRSPAIRKIISHNCNYTICDLVNLLG